ncbi:monocarboxylate transporter 3-like [Diadema antillarum]|uniref:monocarboxylate transporter 3-like n=1 Tax=Diadema antillarum TaxID=105358 RepID=UPI003A8AEBBB
MKSLGVLIPSLVVQLDSTYSTVGFLLSLQLTMTFMACPIAQILIKKFDVRRVSILGGIGTSLPVIGAAFTRNPAVLGAIFFVSGVCSSTLCQASVVLLRQYFGEQFGSASSVSLIGSLVGGMLVPLIGGKLLESYGLFGALLCLGGLFLNSIPIGATLRHPKSTRYTEIKAIELGSLNSPSDALEVECNGNDSECKVKDRKEGRRSCRMILDQVLTVLGLKVLCMEPSFTLFFLSSQILYDTVFIGWALFMVSYAIDVGIDASSAVYLPIAGALGGFASRVILAFAMRCKPRWSPEVHALNLVIAAVALFLYELGNSLWHLLLCSFVSGFGLYGGACTFPACMAVIVHPDNFSGITALSFMLSGIGSVSAGFATGYIYDITQSFGMVFRIFGGLMLVVLLLVVVYIFYDNYVEKRQRSRPSSSERRASVSEEFQKQVAENLVPSLNV